MQISNQIYNKYDNQEGMTNVISKTTHKTGKQQNNINTSKITQIYNKTDMITTAREAIYQ